MAGRFDAAPLAAQNTASIDHKGTSLDATNQFAVEFLFLDDGKLVAQRFIGVAQQREGQILFGLEVFVRLDAVARDACNDAAGFSEFRIEIAELLCFRRATRSAVLGVEIEDQNLAAAGGKSKNPVTCRLALKILKGVFVHGFVGKSHGKRARVSENCRC